MCTEKSKMTPLHLAAKVSWVSVHGYSVRIKVTAGEIHPRARRVSNSATLVTNSRPIHIWNYMYIAKTCAHKLALGGQVHSQLEHIKYIEKGDIRAALVARVANQQGRILLPATLTGGGTVKVLLEWNANKLS